jgi:hypothetical protein
VNHFQNGLKALGAFVTWLCLLLSSGCSAEFFFDKGHADSIGDVVFEIKPPYLYEKKAFKLRGEALSPWQLQQMAEAMPAIAEFTHELLANGTRPHLTPPSNAKARSIRQLQHIEHSTFLAVKTLQNWQVNEGYIQFTTDYFYAGSDGQFVYFRDNYVFRKIRQQWRFEQHAHATPEGLLRCEKDRTVWRQCVPLAHLLPL